MGETTVSKTDWSMKNARLVVEDAVATAINMDSVELPTSSGDEGVGVLLSPEIRYWVHRVSIRET